MAAITTLAIIAGALITVWIDRAQCENAARAIDNGRTMWLYLIEQNPGPEADAFRVELDRRIPPAHCDGGSLKVDPSITSVPATTVQH